MSGDTYTVRSEHTHECGQVFETVTHLVTDPSFSLTISADPPLSLSMDLTRPFTLPPPYKPKMELTAHCNRVEVTGIELKDHRLQCVKCGSDVLYPDGIEPTPTHDGKLGEGYSATFESGYTVIRGGSCDFAELSPQQALSLLAWLEQEKPALEQLAKEQS